MFDAKVSMSATNMPTDVQPWSYPFLRDLGSYCSTLAIKKNRKDGAREIRTGVWTGERIVLEVAA